MHTLFLANTIALSYFYIKGTQKSIMAEMPALTPSQAPSAPTAPTIPTQKAK
ncbi:MAG TPA: hypothetical protein IAA23_00615 [Candidatus Helicobacter avistercoris]|nr:hypothetical protein [Candidatus Helicobacter avistercoris]